MKEQINDMVKDIHQANVDAGWYKNLKYKELCDILHNNVTISLDSATDLLDELGIAENNSFNVGEKLMLIVSEVAEAMEGHRKNLMDDKLPHRSMVEVELADTVIRIFDLAGAMKLDLGGAMEEKLNFNKTRPDHKLENRIKDGGKSY